MPGTSAPLPELQNPRCIKHLTRELCKGGFPPPRDSHRSTRAACPAALLLRVSPVSFPQQHVCASRGHLAAPGPLPFPPPLRWKVFPASSLPTARHASSSFTSGLGRGKKDSSLPQTPSAFPAAQASPPCLGCAFASEGGLNPSCHQPAGHPGPRAGLRLLQNWQPPGVTSPAYICSGTPLSAVARLIQKLLLAK